MFTSKNIIKRRVYFDLLGAFVVLFSSFTLAIINNTKAYAEAQAGNCYISKGYGVVERIVSAYGQTNGGCPSGFEPDDTKCYSYTDGVAPTEFSCGDLQECLSTQGSGYASTIYIPSSADCEAFKIALRGDSQENANDRIAESESLHQADDSESGKFFSYLTIIFTVFSALAGIAMVTSLVVAGIQYATAGDNAGAISKAKSRIVYTLITLLLYVMLFYIITWLIPSDIIV